MGLWISGPISTAARSEPGGAEDRVTAVMPDRAAGTAGLLSTATRLPGHTGSRGSRLSPRTTSLRVSRGAQSRAPALPASTAADAFRVVPASRPRVPRANHPGRAKPAGCLSVVPASTAADAAGRPPRSPAAAAAGRSSRPARRELVTADSRPALPCRPGAALQPPRRRPTASVISRPRARRCGTPSRAPPPDTPAPRSNRGHRS